MLYFNTKRMITGLFAAFVLCVLLTPSLPLAAERDGTTFFFSFEDVKEGVQNPTSSQWSSYVTQMMRQDQVSKESPIERNYRWGNGLGFDGYAAPGSRQPLWGY